LFLYTKNNEALYRGCFRLPDDFGYFGKGISGYIHYMEAFESYQKGGGGGRKPSNSGCGCLTSIVMLFFVLLIVIALLL